MDLKKFGTFILILGIIIIVYGGYQFATNQPKTFNRAESRQTIFGRDDLGNWSNVQSTNMERSEKRENATTIMIAGGIVAFIGLGISFSVKKASANILTADKSGRKTFFCSKCGKEYSIDSLGKFCEECGNKLNVDHILKQKTSETKSDFFSHPLQWYIYSFIFGIPILWTIVNESGSFLFRVKDVIGEIPANFLCGLLNYWTYYISEISHLFMRYDTRYYPIGAFNYFTCYYWYINSIWVCLGGIIGVLSVISLFKQKLYYKKLIMINIVINFLVALLIKILPYLMNSPYVYNMGINESVFIYIIGLAISCSYFIFYFRRQNPR